ncbi:MAG: hypothetical protein AAFX05_02930, partial [Planctomycetota bacterium]
QVGGIPAFGTGPDQLFASVIQRVGYVDLTSASAPDTTNVDEFPGFGAVVDWEWPAETGFLENNDEITLIMITDPSQVGLGQANLIAPPGQPTGVDLVLQAPDAPPVLIPRVPSPGALALCGIAGLSLARRRR